MTAAGSEPPCPVDANARQYRDMSGKTRLLRDDDLRQLLVARGLRVTEQRMTVLRELAKLRIPTSHSELTERLAGDGMDRVTIYRNLLSLTEAGLLIKTQLGDNVWRFELRGSGKALHPEHPHFVCTQCGVVTCLSQVRVKLSPAPGSTRSVVSSISEIVIKGQCTQCA